jgi:hypothetical protein
MAPVADTVVWKACLPTIRRRNERQRERPDIWHQGSCGVMATSNIGIDSQRRRKEAKKMQSGPIISRTPSSLVRTTLGCADCMLADATCIKLYVVILHAVAKRRKLQVKRTTMMRKPWEGTNSLLITSSVTLEMFAPESRYRATSRCSSHSCRTRPSVSLVLSGG